MAYSIPARMWLFIPLASACSPPSVMYTRSSVAVSLMPPPHIRLDSPQLRAQQTPYPRKDQICNLYRTPCRHATLARSGDRFYLLYGQVPPPLIGLPKTQYM